MTPKEAQARIKSRVWQVIAQGDIDVSGLDSASLEALVDAVTAAALIELDEEMASSLAEESEKPAAAEDDVFSNEKEDILWEGRPFLSLTESYTITDERIRITTGMFGKARENVELVRVQDMDYSQTFSERMFKLGDITIRSHDPSHAIIVLRNVRDPEEVYEILRRAVLHARKKHGFTYREEM